MDMRRRLLIAAAIGLASAAICYFYQIGHGNSAGDIWIPLCMARALLARADPYAACRSVHADGVTPATANPLTAGLALIPFTPLPDATIAALIIGLSSGLLAFGLTRDGAWRLLVFLAFPYWDSLRWVQWAPLLMAVALYPALLPLTLIKPHVGTPIALTNLTWRRALGCAAFGLVSLLLDPTWPLRWLDQTSHYTGFVPLLVVPGPLLLAAALRWREHRARFLLLMAAVPQRIFYDQLLLWLIPRTAGELLAMAVASWLAYFLSNIWPSGAATLGVSLIYGSALALLIRPVPDARVAGLETRR